MAAKGILQFNLPNSLNIHKNNQQTIKVNIINYNTKLHPFRNYNFIFILKHF
jgi:hypothetical protein